MTNLFTKSEILSRINDYRVEVGFNEYEGKVNLTFDDYLNNTPKYRISLKLAEVVERKVDKTALKNYFDEIGEEVPLHFANVEVVPDEYEDAGYFLGVSEILGEYSGYYSLDKFLDTFGVAG